jgi:hypothetical protein
VEDRQRKQVAAPLMPANRSKAALRGDGDSKCYAFDGSKAETRQFIALARQGAYRAAIGLTTADRRFTLPLCQ